MEDSEWVNTFGASLVAKHFSPYSSRRFEAKPERTKAPIKLNNRVRQILPGGLSKKYFVRFNMARVSLRLRLLLGRLTA